MDMRGVVGFDWDVANRTKCQKHGVSIADIEAVFGRDPYFSPDLKHSGTETRFIAIGTDRIGRPVFVSFTLREIDDRTFIRPISARYMHLKERTDHAQALAALDDR